MKVFEVKILKIFEDKACVSFKRYVTASTAKEAERELAKLKLDVKSIVMKGEVIDLTGPRCVKLEWAERLGKL